MLGTLLRHSLFCLKRRIVIGDLSRYYYNENISEHIEK
jgi:hypothetical protein